MTNQPNMWNTTLYECNCPGRMANPQSSCLHIRNLRRHAGPAYAFWSNFYLLPLPANLERQQAVHVPHTPSNSQEITIPSWEEETKDEN